VYYQPNAFLFRSGVPVRGWDRMMLTSGAVPGCVSDYYTCVCYIQVYIRNMTTELAGRVGIYLIWRAERRGGNGFGGMCRGPGRDAGGWRSIGLTNQDEGTSSGDGRRQANRNSRTFGPRFNKPKGKIAESSFKLAGHSLHRRGRR